jgi:hypothetical protein
MPAQNATVRRMNDPDTRSPESGSLSDKVLEIAGIIERLVPSAKKPGFSAAAWAPLAELFATDEFQRVGIWREDMDWRLTSSS